MRNLEIFHNFDFFPNRDIEMKFAFISILASSNNLSRSQLLKLSFLVKENGEIISEFDTYVKAVPVLSKAEIEKLDFDYSILRSAPPFCDIASEIIELLENAQTVFKDKFSHSVFKKAFREIGYPMGSSKYFLDKIFKNTLKLSSRFNLEEAIKTFKIEQNISDNLDSCWAMEKIFSHLEDLNNGNQSLPEIDDLSKEHNVNITFSHLPKHPGIYLFKDMDGEIIYVGKAKNIAKRVRSHFSDTSAFELQLCRETASIDFHETGSETIALLLESHYISDLQPKYNSQQIDLINPFIISSKTDSKGILRIQTIQKSFVDSENEYYYNRDSVLNQILEVQRKFFLCKRFAGIERVSGKCSDPVFCKGICQGLEDKEIYNERTKKALQYIKDQRPSYILKLKGRNPFEEGFVLVKHGIYQGFGFIDLDSHINSIEDIESYTRNFSHTYFTSRILDQHFKNTRRSDKNFIVI